MGRHSRCHEPHRSSHLLLAYWRTSFVAQVCHLSHINIFLHLHENWQCGMGLGAKLSPFYCQKKKNQFMSLKPNLQVGRVVALTDRRIFVAMIGMCSLY
jgi:hypothetical protein